MPHGRSAVGAPAAAPAPPSRHLPRRVRIAPVVLLLLLLFLPIASSPATAGSAVLAGSATPASPTGASPSSMGWSTLHGAENRSGSSPFDGPTTSAVLWTRAVTAFAIRAGPVSSGDRIYVADVLGDVAALNRTSNGTVVWRAQVGVAPTTPDLEGGLLYLGDASGNVTALSITNGSTAWRTPVGSPVVQGVAYEGGSVLVATSGGRLEALNGSSGAPTWSTLLPGRLSGGVAWEGPSGFAVNGSGGVFRVDDGGVRVWNASVGAPVTSGPAVFGGRVFVADGGGNVTALSAANGSTLWRFHDPAPADSFNSTPSVSGTLLVIASNSGHDFGLSPTNGSLRWTRNVAPVGYAVLAGSAQGPNGAYLIDASEQVADLEPLTGKVLWLASTGSSFSFTPPALDQGQLIVGDEVGFVFDFSSSAVVPHYPIDGVVVNRTGVPVAGATVAGPGVSTTTSANGSFSVALPNGTFTLVVSALGYPPTNYTIVVNGPHAPVTIALAPLRLYRVEGQVVDALSGAPIPAVNVRVFGAYGYFAENTSDAGGFFQLAVPNGSDYFTVDPPTGYQGIQFRAFVTAGVAVSGPIILALPSTVFLPPSGDPYDSVVIVGVLAAGVAVLVAGLGWRARRKAELGLSQSLLTPFERFLAMRGLLIVPQIVAILVILYVFGTFLPAAALSQDPCSIVGGGCTGCSWSNFACVLTIFAQGFWTFLVNLFTGQWGIAAYGNLRAPAAQFISWWGPYTVELAVVALLMAALIAYPLGLWAGWRPERTVDTSTRVLSIAALLVPSFLVVLLVLGVAYEPFLRTIGDEPYGILPSQTWFVMHGGIPSWVGPGGNTLPTGFPLVDVALHGEWTIETIVLAKTLLQAFLIAIVFIAIFLRFARHTVAEAVAEPHLSASRARGVPEPRLLWYHTGRRVLPIFILILGLTIPVYIGTQALVEAMFNDPGLGTLLLAEMTNVEVTRFGFASLNGLHPGNVYQVAIFFTALVVLLASLCADIIARLLDPRLAANEGV